MKRQSGARLGAVRTARGCNLCAGRTGTTPRMVTRVRRRWPREWDPNVCFLNQSSLGYVHNRVSPSHSKVGLKPRHPNVWVKCKILEDVQIDEDWKRSMMARCDGVDEVSVESASQSHRSP
ncbi:hypothetical protein PanWU01x14_340970 [Parasponia andersonii]|uniref:Uncharacterized protein n=1 Tax=Parasponia andersonii TaxID=3476 RepID=A0A2P5AEA5_PARAD|nr:hypothetical protein PanWU01x14_340970 [Parasponia andersonii]